MAGVVGVLIVWGSIFAFVALIYGNAAEYLAYFPGGDSDFDGVFTIADVWNSFLHGIGSPVLWVHQYDPSFLVFLRVNVADLGQRALIGFVFWFFAFLIIKNIVSEMFAAEVRADARKKRDAAVRQELTHEPD